MASYHLSAKIGSKGKGAAHSAYISREGKYSEAEHGARYEDLEAKGHGNMPEWAKDDPSQFWTAADQYERKNGSAYREIEVALPRELDAAQRKELVTNYIGKEIGDKHAYQWAIHNPNAALEKGEQPHAHIMYSERTNDGIERAPDQYFKRYNSKEPEKGGCKKESGGKNAAELKDELAATRERWATVQNEHLAAHGHEDRVDHRSLKEQGIDREPEKHLGGKGVRRLEQQEISALLERRAAEGANERASKEVSGLDLSGDIAAAKADREKKNTPEIKPSDRLLKAAKERQLLTQNEARNQPEMKPSDRLLKSAKERKERVENTPEARAKALRSQFEETIKDQPKAAQELYRKGFEKELQRKQFNEFIKDRPEAQREALTQAFEKQLAEREKGQQTNDQERPQGAHQVKPQEKEKDSEKLFRAAREQREAKKAEPEKTAEPAKPAAPEVPKGPEMEH